MSLLFQFECQNRRNEWLGLNVSVVIPVRDGESEDALNSIVYGWLIHHGCDGDCKSTRYDEGSTAAVFYMRKYLDVYSTKTLKFIVRYHFVSSRTRAGKSQRDDI